MGYTIYMKQRYFKHKIENLLHVTRIVTVHYFDFEESYKSHGESHDFWEMVYADKNSLVCTVEGREVLLKEGEAIFHAPNEFHIHSADGKNAPSVFIISFECKSEAIRILESRCVKLSKEAVRYVYMLLDEAKSTFDLRHTSPDVKKMPLSEKPTLGGMQYIKNLLELLLIGTVRQVDGEDETPSFVLREDFGEYLVNSVIEQLSGKSEAIRILESRCVKLSKEAVRYVYMLLDEAKSTFDLRHTSPDVKKMPLSEKPTLGGMQYIKNLLELLLIGTVRQVDGEDETPSFVLREDFGEYLVNSVIEQLSENVSGRISIDEICKRMNYTRSYIFRQFKRVTGQSIMAYFTSLKIKEAKRLLRETEMSVTEIAAALSFDTPNYFSKTFKRLTGSTPLEYRRARRAW